MTGRTMAEVNAVIEILIEMHKNKKLELVRLKDRFMEEPSGGGWRDSMVNIVVADGDTKHICEIQVVHHLMLNARKEMAGHVVVRWAV